VEDYLFLISVIIFPIAIVLLSFIAAKTFSSKRPSEENQQGAVLPFSGKITRFLKITTILLFIASLSQILIFPAWSSHLKDFHSIVFGGRFDILQPLIFMFIPVIIISSLGYLNLYFKYIPSFRKKYLHRLAIIFNVVLIVNLICFGYYYLSGILGWLMPLVISPAIVHQGVGIWDETYQTLTLPILGFVIFYLANKRFQKKRSPRSMQVYKLTFVLFTLLISAYLYNLFLSYFTQSVYPMDRLAIFNINLFFAGIFILILIALFITSFIYLYIIYSTQDKLLARPFSWAYILKLARINHLSSFSLVLLIALPWLIKQYFILFT